MESPLAPIVLLVYNRPDKTRQTLESLMRNDLADHSELYIYADGAKPDAGAEELGHIVNTRKLIREKQWCKQIHIVELNENLGVDRLTINAVSNILSSYHKIIVLEDDLITSQGFLTYMNRALNLYEKEEKVMHVSAYCFPISQSKTETFFLFGGTSSWGWGTWKRAWDNFETDHHILLRDFEKKPELLKQFNFDNTFDYFEMLKNCNETEKPWDIRWYASVFLKGGYGLWPAASLVQNIGHDNSGVHRVNTSKFSHTRLATQISPSLIPVIEDRAQRKKISKFFSTLYKTGIVSRIKAYFFS